jgi:hypothetical protein
MSVIIRPTVPFTPSQRGRLQRWLSRSSADFRVMQCYLSYHQGAILVELPTDLSVSEVGLGHILAEKARDAMGDRFQYVLEPYHARSAEKRPSVARRNRPARLPDPTYTEPSTPPPWASELLARRRPEGLSGP